MWRNPLRENVGRIVIVNTIAGKERAFRGALDRADEATLTLSDVVLVEPEQVPLGGLVVIERANVAWVQVV